MCLKHHHLLLRNRLNLDDLASIQDSKSLIIHNPNDWSKEHKNPTYIYDLLLSIINLSVQTVDTVNSLPKLVL